MIALCDIHLLIFLYNFAIRGKDKTLKTTFENHNINFSNSDFLVDITSICTKLLEYFPYSPPEGSVSQNFDLGPGNFFMLCRNFGKTFFHYYLRFMSYKI